MPNGFPHFQIDEEEGRFFWRLFGDVGKLMARCPEAGLESREACEAIRWVGDHARDAVESGPVDWTKPDHE